MPKKVTKRETRRPAPYNLRVPSSTTATTMATALVSPVTPWTPSHHQQTWPSPHMPYQQQYGVPNFGMSYQPPMPQHHHAHSQEQELVPAPQHPGQSAPWTAEEDDILMNAKTQGLGWKDIHERHFPTKSGNACRKRHERLVIKLRTTDWDENRVKRVLAEYNSPGVREDFWMRLADRLGERWEDVERVCFQSGLKGLRSTAQASSHSRGRSRASSGLGHVSGGEYDDRTVQQAAYHGAGYENEDKFPEQDDSGIDLGMPGPTMPTHSRRASHAGSYNLEVQPPPTTIPGISSLMHHRSSSNGGYEYQR